MPSHLEHEPRAQQSLEDSRVREMNRLSPRERLVEVAAGGCFLVTAVALVLLAGGSEPFDWSSAVITVLSLAAVSRIEFEVGSTYTMPLQIVLVPMLFLVPPAALPLCVATGLVLGKAPDALLGRRPLGRVLMKVADSW